MCIFFNGAQSRRGLQFNSDGPLFTPSVSFLSKILPASTAIFLLCSVSLISSYTFDKLVLSFLEDVFNCILRLRSHFSTFKESTQNIEAKLQCMVPAAMSIFTD